MVRAAGGAAGLLELGRATEEGLAGLGLDDAAAAAVWAAWPAAVQVGSLSLSLSAASPQHGPAAQSPPRPLTSLITAGYPKQTTRLAGVTPARVSAPPNTGWARLQGSHEGRGLAPSTSRERVSKGRRTVAVNPALPQHPCPPPPPPSSHVYTAAAGAISTKS